MAVRLPTLRGRTLTLGKRLALLVGGVALGPVAEMGDSVAELARLSADLRTRVDAFTF